MSSRHALAMVPTLAAVLAIAGLAAAEQPAPPPDDESATGTGATTTEEPSPTPDQRYHEQQVQPDRDRSGDLPPVGARGSAEPRSGAMPGASDYVVEEGDTLATIAEQKLGNANQWKQIAKMNQIDDPDKLEVGTRLRLPARGDRGEDRPDQASKPDRDAENSPSSSRDGMDD